MPRADREGYIIEDEEEVDASMVGVYYQQNLDELNLPPAVRMIMQAAHKNHGYTLTPMQAGETALWVAQMIDDMIGIYYVVGELQSALDAWEYHGKAHGCNDESADIVDTEDTLQEDTEADLLEAGE